MLWANYLKVALRSLLRRKIFSSINMFGLALGLACCLVVALFVRQELSYDRFHENAEKIVRIREDLFRDAEVFESIRNPSWMGPAMVESFPEVRNQTRIVRGGGVVNQGDLRSDERLFFADASFLTVFSFPLLSGNPVSALAEPSSAVITRRLALKYFGEEDALGKTLTVDGKYPFKITGILADIPENSHIKFDFLGSFDHTRNIFGEERYRDGRVSAYTYLLLDQHESAGPLEAKIPAFLSARRGEQYAAGRRIILQPLTSIHLGSHVNLELEKNSRISSSYLLSAVALLILLIACSNYINLSTAGSSGRSREVGIRKVIGADRGRLFRQFMGESLILAVLSAVPAVCLAQAILPVFNGLMGRKIGLGSADAGLWLGFLALILVIGAAAGAYPALILASARPAQSLKGLRDRTRLSSLLIRKGLVVVQFVLAAAFIIGTLLVARQMNFIRAKDLGFDREGIAILPPPLGKDGAYQAFKAEILAIPGILDMTAATSVPGQHPGIAFSFVGSESGGEGVSLEFTSVDFNYFDFFGMAIISGRPFDSRNTADVGTTYVLNESAVKALGWTDPLGKSLREKRGETSGTVIGVVKDFHNVSLHEDVRPGVYQVEPRMFGATAVRIAPGKTPQALEAMKKKWAEWAPYHLFYSSFLDETLESLYREDRKVGGVFGFAALLSVIIACLGLIGLSIFFARQKVKEIGIRKVLGASPAGLVLLLFRNVGGSILLANILAWPLVYSAVSRWQEQFAFRAAFSPWPYILGGVLVLTVSFIAGSAQALKASLANPVDSLKYE
ncbi:MAG: ABC transporter permease [Candidatus Aminicenantes bacterium]|nr:ABC transporter permease [Candidatus Aminicenantes bacterium]